MCFPDFEGPPEEFLVVEHDSIGKAYLVQWPDSAPKREDETWLHRLLLSYPQAVMVEANDLDANDPLLLEYSRYETSGGRARTSPPRARPCSSKAAVGVAARSLAPNRTHC